VFFVELGGDEQYSAEVAAWKHEVERVELERLQPWFPSGVEKLQEAEVRQRIKALGQGVHEQLRQAHLATQAPGNLRRHNPSFVGRVAELRALRQQLTGGAVGVVTAVHGIGGMGKTELAVAYAHAYAHDYQGGTWQMDADGQVDMLEAVSSLALSSQLGLEVREEDLRDRQWLGRRALARLTELTEAARQRDSNTAACLLLLDNVSEPELLSESQLAALPDQPWLHLMVTTRLGMGDVAAAGSRASVAMIEVGRLGTADALALIREHQPARDHACLHPDFSNADEADAARRIIDLLDGYTLAIEQVAVFLGVTGVEPSQLLADLQALGTPALDQVGSSPEGTQAIRHKERLTGRIVDQTLWRLPDRARAALAVASLLPPDTIPWDWLRWLTEPAESQPLRRLSGLSGQDDWTSTRRILEGRRLLTLADDSRFARLHRVVHAHLRTRLVDREIEDRLDRYLKHVAGQLADSTAPDTAILAATAATLIARLSVGSVELAHAASRLVDHVHRRLDLTSARRLANTIITVFEQSAGLAPSYQRVLAILLCEVGDFYAEGGDARAALDHITRGKEIFERLATTYPGHLPWRLDVITTLQRVSDISSRGGECVARAGLGDARPRPHRADRRRPPRQGRYPISIGHNPEPGG
jgi:hypothetical protein